MEKLNLDVMEVSKALALTAHAWDQTDTRKNLCGLNFRIDGDDAVFEATDGHRAITYRFPKGCERPFPNLELIDSSKPACNQTAPSGESKTIKFETVSLRNALEAIKAVPFDKIVPAKFTFPDAHSVLIKGVPSEYAISVKIHAKSCGAVGVEFGIDGQYLLDFLDAVETVVPKGKPSFAHLEFFGQLIGLKWTCPELPGLSSIIMPMRLEW